MSCRFHTRNGPDGGHAERSPFQSRNPHKLYRNPGRGRLFGVAAGIADYFGIEPLLVRIGLVIGGFAAFMPVVLAYLLAAALLPRKPERLYADPREEEFWRTVNLRPERSVVGLKETFRSLEQRLNGLEGYVASSEFELNRAINDLDR